MNEANAQPNKATRRKYSVLVMLRVEERLASAIDKLTHEASERAGVPVTTSSVIRQLLSDAVERASGSPATS